MSMQGKCWSLGLSDLAQQGENYLEGSRRFGGRGEYPYGTLYSALGMAIHAVPGNYGEVLFGAPGTFSWTGTLAAKRFHFEHFSKISDKDSRQEEFLLGDLWDNKEMGDDEMKDMRNDDYGGYAITSGTIWGQLSKNENFKSL